MAECANQSMAGQSSNGRQSLQIRHSRSPDGYSDVTKQGGAPPEGSTRRERTILERIVFNACLDGPTRVDYLWSFPLATWIFPDHFHVPGWSGKNMVSWTSTHAGFCL